MKEFIFASKAYRNHFPLKTKKELRQFVRGYLNTILIHKLTERALQAQNPIE